MATYSGYLMTGVPVNREVDILNVYSSATSSGTFALEEAMVYEYSTRVTNYSIDDSKFYKISYEDTSDGYVTPLSEATAGVTILEAAPILDITSSNDGASFASVQEVYDRSNITTADISETNVNYSLSVARAFIDMRLSTISIDRYRVFADSVQTRKYNASLRIIKDVEINYCLSLVYKYMADAAILEDTTSSSSTSTATSIRIGQTTISDKDASGSSDSIEAATNFDALSTRYAQYAETALDSLAPNYVPLRYAENGTGYDFGTSAIISYAHSASFSFVGGIILDREEL